MVTPLLVATPHPSFGELIRQSLEETGSYSVRVVNSRSDAIAAVNQDKSSIAFLDLDLGDDVVSETGRHLRTAKPDITLILICGDEKPPILDDIRPWTLLRKPFYLPELLQMLGETPGGSTEIDGDDETPDAKVEDKNEEIPWLEDVNKAAQHLTRLTLESSAQAALITRKSALWAYAGQLSQDAALEIAMAIARYWDTQKESDLLRFVRLESTKAEHMLYATRLATGIIMALIFDAETPFSTIRSQANSLAQSLSISESRPQASQPLPAPNKKPVEPVSKSKDALIGDEAEDTFEVPSISSILFDVPPPNPAPIPQVTPAQMQAAESVPDDDLDDELELEYPASVIETRPSASSSRHGTFSREASPAIPLHELVHTGRSVNMQTVDDAQPTPATEEDLDSTLPSKVRRPATPVRPPAPGELDETKPSSVTEVARRIILEPTSPGLYNLTYACLLVPRLSAHFLAGDLADNISQWIPQICIAFGWRLEFLAVRPEYLQWVVNVPPSTSPGYLMRIMRQQTSEHIFAKFIRLKQENPSGDFWAPGYLIMGGDQPHPPQLVKDYINQTRQRQGISRPRSRR